LHRSFSVLESELKVNLFLMQYCRMLVEDIADERMAEQPIAGVNHPAWVLGHLALSNGLEGRFVRGWSRKTHWLRLPAPADASSFLAGGLFYPEVRRFGTKSG
jgi:hypothetical protein